MAHAVSASVCGKPTPISTRQDSCTANKSQAGENLSPREIFTSLSCAVILGPVPNQQPPVHTVWRCAKSNPSQLCTMMISHNTPSQAVIIQGTPEPTLYPPKGKKK